MTPDYLLFERFPRLRETLPRIPLGRFPTPVRLLERGLCKSIDELWVKDDGKSSDLYGGNKVRKLELVLADAGQKGSKRIVTVGGAGSHHVLATAAFAGQMGIRTTGILVDQPLTANVLKNLRLGVYFGADLVPVKTRAGLAARAAAEFVKATLAGERPYLLLPGGSTPRTVLAYANAALELARQVERGECPEPEGIFVAAGSGGTAAGLLLGLHLSGLKTRLHAVQVVEPPLSSAGAVRLLAGLGRRELERLSGERIPPVPGDRLVFETGYLGREYGWVTPESLRAVALAHEWCGLPLETTYTGKALACLIDPARRFSGRQMFWNTYNGADQPPAAAGTGENALPPAVRAAVERMRERCGEE